MTFRRYARDMRCAVLAFQAKMDKRRLGLLLWVFLRIICSLALGLALGLALALVLVATETHSHTNMSLCSGQWATGNVGSRSCTLLVFMMGHRLVDTLENTQNRFGCYSRRLLFVDHMNIVQVHWFDSLLVQGIYQQISNDNNQM